MTRKILIVGGTGAQGSSLVRFLACTNSYTLKCITRDTTTSHAQELTSIPKVSLIAGDYDDASLTAALEGVDYVWVNANGFALGGIGETSWGIRLFELSVRAGVKHFIYSGIESAYKKSGYDPKMYVGHYEGKAREAEFMHALPTLPMAWTVIDSGAYLENFSELFCPCLQDGVLTLILPLASGYIPMIYLDDQAKYVDWAFKDPAESNGVHFAVSTCHLSGADWAAAYTTVTGKPAKYQAVPTPAWLQAAFSTLPNGVDTKIGAGKTHNSVLLQTYGEDFGNWFELYKATGNNTGLLTRDYAFLEKIMPERVKSLEEWMRLVGYTGEYQPLLKDLSERNATENGVKA